MEYYTHFIFCCPETGAEDQVIVHFYKDEQPADRLEYWGTIIPLPATNDITIKSVFRNGKEWTDFPEFIEQEIYSHNWEVKFNRA